MRNKRLRITKTVPAIKNVKKHEKTRKIIKNHQKSVSGILQHLPNPLGFQEILKKILKKI